MILEFKIQGTHSGEWLAMKPKYKKLVFNGINIYRVKDGKIIEPRVVMNTFEISFKANIIQLTQVF